MKPSVKIYNRTKSTRIRKKHYKLIEKELIKLSKIVNIAVNKYVEIIRNVLTELESGVVCECHECGEVERVKKESLGKRCSKCNGRLIPLRFKI